MVVAVQHGAHSLRGMAGVVCDAAGRPVQRAAGGCRTDRTSQTVIFMAYRLPRRALELQQSGATFTAFIIDVFRKSKSCKVTPCT